MRQPTVSVEELNIETTEGFGFRQLDGNQSVNAVTPYDDYGKTNFKLFAVSNTWEFFYAAGANGITRGALSDLRTALRSKGELPIQTFEHRKRVQFLQLTADEEYLIIVNEDGSVELLELEANVKSNKFTARDLDCKFKNVKDVQARPAHRHQFGILDGLGLHIVLATGKERLVVESMDVTCFAWTLHGVQALIGHRDGKVRRAKISSGEVVEEFMFPGEVDPGTEVSCTMLAALSETDFIVVYSAVLDDEIQDYLGYVAKRNEDNESYTFSHIDIVCPPMPDSGRTNYIYSEIIRKWKKEPPYFAILVAATSTVTTIVSDKASLEMMDDTDRLDLPQNKQFEDTSALGMGLDLMSSDGVDSMKPQPILLILNDEGAILGWDVLWRDGIHKHDVSVKTLRHYHKEHVMEARKLRPEQGFKERKAVDKVAKPVNDRQVTEDSAKEPLKGSIGTPTTIETSMIKVEPATLDRPEHEKSMNSHDRPTDGLSEEANQSTGEQLASPQQANGDDLSKQHRPDIEVHRRTEAGTESSDGQTTIECSTGYGGSDPGDHALTPPEEDEGPVTGQAGHGRKGSFIEEYYRKSLSPSSSRIMHFHEKTDDASVHDQPLDNEDAVELSESPNVVSADRTPAEASKSKDTERKAGTGDISSRSIFEGQTFSEISVPTKEESPGLSMPALGESIDQGVSHAQIPISDDDEDKESDKETADNSDDSDEGAHISTTPMQSFTRFGQSSGAAAFKSSWASQQSWAQSAATDVKLEESAKNPFDACPSGGAFGGFATPSAGTSAFAANVSSAFGGKPSQNSDTVRSFGKSTTAVATPISNSPFGNYASHDRGATSSPFASFAGNTGGSSTSSPFASIANQNTEASSPFAKFAVQTGSMSSSPFGSFTAPTAGAASSLGGAGDNVQAESATPFAPSSWSSPLAKVSTTTTGNNSGPFGNIDNTVDSNMAVSSSPFTNISTTAENASGLLGNTHDSNVTPSFSQAASTFSFEAVAEKPYKDSASTFGHAAEKENPSANIFSSRAQPTEKTAVPTLTTNEHKAGIGLTGTSELASGETVASQIAQIPISGDQRIDNEVSKQGAPRTDDALNNTNGVPQSATVAEAVDSYQSSTSMEPVAEGYVASGGFGGPEASSSTNGDTSGGQRSDESRREVSGESTDEKIVDSEEPPAAKPVNDREEVATSSGQEDISSETSPEEDEYQSHESSEVDDDDDDLSDYVKIEASEVEISEEPEEVFDENEFCDVEDVDYFIPSRGVAEIPEYMTLDQFVDDIGDELSDFDLVYAETNAQFRAVDANSKRLAMYMQWQSSEAQTLLTETDVNQPDLWRLSNGPAVGYVLEKQLTLLKKFNADCRNAVEHRLPDLKKLLSSSVATLLGIKESIVVNASEKDRRTLELRSLPAPVVEQQRDIRRLHGKVETLVRELESSITVLKASLARCGSPSSQPSIQNVLRSVDKIQKICDSRARSIEQLERSVENFCESSAAGDRTMDSDITTQVAEIQAVRNLAFDEMAFAANRSIRHITASIGARLRCRAPNSIVSTAEVEQGGAKPVN